VVRALTFTWRWKIIGVFGAMSDLNWFKHLKILKGLKMLSNAGGMAVADSHPHSKCEDLSSNLSTDKKKKKKEEEVE
jgi:hypothetical protein